MLSQYPQLRGGVTVGKMATTGQQDCQEIMQAQRGVSLYKNDHGKEGLLAYRENPWEETSKVALENVV